MQGVFTKNVFEFLTVCAHREILGATMKAAVMATAMRTSNKTSPISKWKKKTDFAILHVQRAFLFNLFEHDVKCPFATLFGGREQRDKFNFFSQSEPWVRTPKFRRKFTYISHFKRVEINAKNLKIKTHLHFDSYRRFRCPRCRHC